MTVSLSDNLHEVLRSVRTRPLFVMHLDVSRLQILNATPRGFRRVGVVYGGAFEGERLSGEVLDGSSDWQTVRSDGATILNVRLVLKTSDDALISMAYPGYATAHPTSSSESRRAKRSIPPPTIFESRLCSRQRLPNMTG
jgi:hypothetical protein